MAHEHAFEHSELKSLIEQLCLSREHLDQLISQLYKLNHEAELSTRYPAAQETTPAEQEWRKGSNNQPDFLPRSTIIADHPHMQVAAGLVHSMAELDAAVLIQGATGTGKSLFARQIHHQGKRSLHHFVTVPCRQFNHPDAIPQIKELFTEAGRGSLILEDVDELLSPTQEHLTRFLQQPKDCRLISLTCKNLDELVRQKLFSAVLLEQLRECHISLPSLANRNGDIEQLAHHYCRQFCVAADMAQKNLSPEYLDLLTLYTWPGNVRELINTLEQSLLCAGGQKTLYVKDLPAHIRIQTLRLSSAHKKGL